MPTKLTTACVAKQTISPSFAAETHSWGELEELSLIDSHWSGLKMYMCVFFKRLSISRSIPGVGKLVKHATAACNAAWVICLELTKQDHVPGVQSLAFMESNRVQNVNSHLKE